MGLYDNVKSMCKEKHTNVFTLENDLGFPRSSICKWNENIPSVAKVQRVAEKLGVSLDELIDGVTFPVDKKETE